MLTSVTVHRRPVTPSTLHPHHHHCPRSSSFLRCPPFTTPPRASQSLIRRHHLPMHYINGGLQLYESQFQLKASYKLKIAIVGFGNFGQFLAKTLTSQGHTVLAHSRSDYSYVAIQLGVRFFRDPNDLCEEHPDVILLCTSIISTEKLLKTFPFQRLKRNTLFVDALSAKEFAKDLLLRVLPPYFDIICTHPMFGRTESAKPGWKGRFFVYEKVRVGDEERRISRCHDFLNIFAREGCVMADMSCAEHDKHAAGSQFITHTVGRMLKMLNLESTPINTKGYEKLLGLVEMTTSSGDNFDLYYGLFVYNKNALQMLERLDLAFEELRKELFGRLHDVFRKQLIGRSDHNMSSVQEHYAAATTFMDYQTGSASLAASTSKPGRYICAHESRNGKFNDSAIQIDKKSNLKIAIVGFGNFGQFLAKTFVRQGHTVLAYSRTDYSDIAKTSGVSFFSDADDLCEEHPDVILLCTSILSTEKVLRSLPLHRLKRSTLFVDVLSVKEFPKRLFLQNLPFEFDILCTHPMFGPVSGKNGWNDLAFVYDRVRIGTEESRTSRCEDFLNIFASEGCKMVEMCCDEHDKYAAGSQFVTHTVGRVLEKFGLESTPINTKGYETLLNLVENTAGNSLDLYYGLFLYNANAMEQLDRLEYAFESLKKQLFGSLHGLLRKRLFRDADNKLVHQHPAGNSSKLLHG